MQLNGPTLFAPVIGKAAVVAAERSFDRDPTALKKGVFVPQVYTVLLIITDGVINDMVLQDLHFLTRRFPTHFIASHSASISPPFGTLTG